MRRFKGIASTIGTVPGFVSPIVIAYLTPNVNRNFPLHYHFLWTNGHFALLQGTASEWANVFYISASLYLLGALIYLIFGTSDRQKWARTATELPERDERLYQPPNIVTNRKSETIEVLDSWTEQKNQSSHLAVPYCSLKFIRAQTMTRSSSFITRVGAKFFILIQHDKLETAFKKLYFTTSKSG